MSERLFKSLGVKKTNIFLLNQPETGSSLRNEQKTWSYKDPCFYRFLKAIERFMGIPFIMGFIPQWGSKGAWFC